MNFRISFSKISISFIFVALLTVAAWYFGRDSFQTTTNTATQSLLLPDYSMTARAGMVAFDANCASCHGSNGTGTDKGPPLLHEIYNPGHHSDGSFVAAVRQGVRSHHWNFGNMPAQPQVNDEEITEIIRYVRELQVANGIVYREHRMQ